MLAATHSRLCASGWFICKCNGRMKSAAVLKQVPLDILQFHGDETP